MASRSYVCPGTEWGLGGTKCGCNRVPAQWIEELVWAEVRPILSDPQRLLDLANEYLGAESEIVDARKRDVDFEKKIADLEMAKTTRVTEALKAGLDPMLLKAAVAELDSELVSWRREYDRVRTWTERSELLRDRTAQLQQLTVRAKHRLDSLSVEKQRIVLEALELKVQVLDWRTCAGCGGSGKQKGGRGGIPCPDCRMKKHLPTLRLLGVWKLDIEVQREALSITGGVEPRPGCLR
jgi:hypothetical protein